MLLLIALLFAHACTFHVAEAVSWCDDTPAFGDYTLAANDVCTLTTQIKVTNGNTLSIIGEETESSTDLALITQNEVADNGVIFQGGRSFLGGGIYAFGSESVVWMGSGCKVIEN